MVRRLIGLLLLIMITISPYRVTAEDDNQMKVHFIDVGQADSILIQTPEGKNLLVDTGDERSGKKLIGYLNQRGVEIIDAMIITHPHHDHIGGVAELLKAFKVNAYYMSPVTHDTKIYKKLKKTLDKKGVMIFEAKAGDSVKVEHGIKINIIGPIGHKYDDVNDYSYILKLIHKDNTFLFMADAGEQSETDLLEKKVNLKADVLKIGHHGADTGTTLPFLKRVDPEAAVISVGRGNRFGFPKKSVINRLRYLKIPTYRTDLMGSVIAISNGNTIQFRTNSYAGSVRQHELHK